MNIDFLQELCSKWPGVTTDVKWGNDFVFSVAEKMFCVSSLEPPTKIAFKVNDEEFEEVSMREGFMPAPYMARNKWVLVTNPGKLTKKEWEHYVKQSYELVKSKLPKKIQEKLDKEPASAKPARTERRSDGAMAGRQGRSENSRKLSGQKAKKAKK